MKTKIWISVLAISVTIATGSIHVIGQELAAQTITTRSLTWALPAIRFDSIFDSLPRSWVNTLSSQEPFDCMLGYTCLSHEFPYREPFCSP